MKGKFEGMRLYQTLAEPGEDYPALPDLASMDQVNSVWYVKELTNASYDPTDAVPEITATDTGKRFYAFNMANGSVMGTMAQTRGMSRTYLKEGSYLSGFWHNGQLYVMPIMEGYGCTKCNAVRKKRGLQWKVTVPAVDAWWVNLSESEHTLTDDIFPLDDVWNFDWQNTFEGEFSHLYGTSDRPVNDGTLPYDYVDYCRAGLKTSDVEYLTLGDDAYTYYGSNPWAGVDPPFDDPWVEGNNFISVYIRHVSTTHEVLLSVCVNTSAEFRAYAYLVFTGLYRPSVARCLPTSQQTYNRVGVAGVTRADGKSITPTWYYENNIASTLGETLYEQAADQLPTSVTVEQVES